MMVNDKYQTIVAGPLLRVLTGTLYKPWVLSVNQLILLTALVPPLDSDIWYSVKEQLPVSIKCAKHLWTCRRIDVNIMYTDYCINISYWIEGFNNKSELLTEKNGYR